MSSRSWWADYERGVPRWLVAVAVSLLVSVIGLGSALFLRDQRHESVPVQQLRGVSEPADVAVFLGDSYTAGANASDPARRWSNIVGAERGWDVRNYARGGTGFATDVTGSEAAIACGSDYCESFLEAIERAAGEEPDVVVLSGGRNDARLDASEARADIIRVVDALSATFPGAEIYVTSPLWDDRRPPDSISTMSSALQDGASEIGATYVDLGQPLSGHSKYISDDDVHPNDLGHEAIARAFLQQLS